jgi:hypothetical protein
MQRIFIKKCFLFMVGSVRCVMQFTTGIRNCHVGDRRSADDEEVETEMLKRLRTVKRLLCCGFRHTSIVMGQLYQCWWRICRELNVLSGSNITCFTFYIHL